MVRGCGPLPAWRTLFAPAFGGLRSPRRGRLGGGFSSALRDDEAAELALGLLDVALVLEDHVQRVAHDILVEVTDALSAISGPRPVEGLTDRGRLLEVELAETLHHADQLLGERSSMPAPSCRGCLHSSFSFGEVDVEVEAAALQGVAHFAGVVAEVRKTSGLVLAAFDGADLGHRDLEVREDLEQEGLELGVRLVDLVDQQQSSARLGLDRLQQGARAR